MVGVVGLDMVRTERRVFLFEGLPEDENHTGAHPQGIRAHASAVCSCPLTQASM